VQLTNERRKFCPNNILVKIIPTSYRQGVSPILFVKNSSNEEEDVTLTVEFVAGVGVVAVVVVDGLRVAPGEECCLEVPLALPRGDYVVNVYVLTRAGCEREFRYRLLETGSAGMPKNQ